jgi:phage repressor protein C with HTH and peptisase S24 domain
MRNPAAEMVRGPYVSSTEDWYAIAIADSTMGPRYEAGDYVYAAQNTMVRSKDFVVVRVAGRIGKTPVQLGFVRQLLRRTADEIVVRQLNPNVETVIRQSALLGIDRIVLSGEIVGETDR